MRYLLEVPYDQILGQSHQQRGFHCLERGCWLLEETPRHEVQEVNEKNLQLR